MEESYLGLRFKWHTGIRARCRDQCDLMYQGGALMPVDGALNDNVRNNMLYWEVGVYHGSCDLCADDNMKSKA